MFFRLGSTDGRLSSALAAIEPLQEAVEDHDQEEPGQGEKADSERNDPPLLDVKVMPDPPFHLFVALGEHVPEVGEVDGHKTVFDHMNEFLYFLDVQNVPRNVSGEPALASLGLPGVQLGNRKADLLPGCWGIEPLLRDAIEPVQALASADLVEVAVDGEPQQVLPKAGEVVAAPPGFRLQNRTGSFDRPVQHQTLEQRHQVRDKILVADARQPRWIVRMIS